MQSLVISRKQLASVLMWYRIELWSRESGYFWIVFLFRCKNFISPTAFVSTAPPYMLFNFTSSHFVPYNFIVKKIRLANQHR